MRRSLLRDRENHLEERRRRERMRRSQEEERAAYRLEQQREAERKEREKKAREEHYIALVKRMLYLDMKEVELQPIPWVQSLEEFEDPLGRPPHATEVFEQEKAYVEKLFTEGCCTEDEMLEEITRLSEEYARACRSHLNGMGWFWMKFCQLYRRGAGYENWQQEYTAWALKEVEKELGVTVRPHLLEFKMIVDGSGASTSRG